MAQVLSKSERLVWMANSIKLQQLSKKNEINKEYSLGDVLLLDKWEKELYSRGYSREEIESLSPSYYG